MIAKIGFVDHRIECIVGVNPSEREIEQEILLDLLVQYDVQKAVEDDDVNGTCDYSQMAKELTRVVKEGKFQLIETLAYKCIQEIKSKYPLIQWISITVKKPQALRTARYATVQIEKSF